MAALIAVSAGPALAEPTGALTGFAFTTAKCQNRTLGLSIIERNVDGIFECEELEVNPGDRIFVKVGGRVVCEDAGCSVGMLPTEGNIDSIGCENRTTGESFSVQVPAPFHQFFDCQMGGIEVSDGDTVILKLAGSGEDP
jgi:hypothetical protein